MSSSSSDEEERFYGHVAKRARKQLSRPSAEPFRRERDARGDSDESEDDGGGVQSSLVTTFRESRAAFTQPGTQLVVADRFEIPTRDADLLESGYVREVEVADVIKGIEGYAYEASNGDWSHLRSFLDEFFAIARFDSKVKDAKVRMDAVRALLLGVQESRTELIETLAIVLTSDGTVAPEVRRAVDKHADHLTMSIYLLWRIVSDTEALINRTRTAAAAARDVQEAKESGEPPTKKGRGRLPKKTATADDERAADAEVKEWRKLRSLVLDSIEKTLKVTVADSTGTARTNAIVHLWSPPEVDRPLLCALLELVMKLLEERPERGELAARKAWLVQLFTFVGTLCNSFKLTALAAPILLEKTVHLDYVRDATTFPFVEPMLIVGSALEPLLTSMVRHVANLSVEEAAASARSYGLFLQTVAERAPASLLPNLAALKSFVSADAAALRSSVLAVLGDVLRSDHLSESKLVRCARLRRSALSIFSILLEHVTDTQPQVRARVLGTWTKLARAQRIPRDVIAWGLVSVIGRRMGDKALLVRKAAVGFMAAFLENNPFGHDWSYASNSRRLEEELELLRKFKAADPERDIVKEIQSEWEILAHDSRPILMECIEKELQDRGGMWKDEEADIEDDDDESAMDQDAGDKDREEELSDDRQQLKILFEKGGANKTLSVLARRLADEPNEACSLIAWLAVSGRVATHGESSAERCDFLMNTLKDAFMLDQVEKRQNDEDFQIRKEMTEEDITKALASKKKSVQFLTEKLTLELEMAWCIPLALRGVLQGEMSEMKEAIKFVVDCKQYEVRGAAAAVRVLCSLVWRKGQDVRNELLEAALKMFVSTHDQAKVRDESTANNLLAVVRGMREDETAAMEEVLALTIAQHPLSAAVYKNIADRAQPSSTDTVERTTALRLLALLATAQKKAVAARLRDLQTFVASKTSSHADRSDALAVLAGLSVRPPPPPPSSGLKTVEVEDMTRYRLQPEDSLWFTIESFVIERLVEPDEPSDWARIARHALDIIFGLSRHVCSLLSRLVSRVVVALKEIVDMVAAYESKLVELGQEDASRSEDDELRRLQTRDLALDRLEYWKKMHAIVLERVIFLSGEVAVRTLNYVETTFVRDVRRLGENALAIRAQGSNRIMPFGMQRPLEDWEWRGAVRRGIFDFEGNIGDTGVSEEERVRVRAENVCNRVMQPNRLLGRLFPLVVYCARSKAATQRVRAAASLAFSKFILLNRSLASRGSWQFFAMLSNSPHAVVRSNMLVAAADLASRAPHEVDRFSSDIYHIMRDDESAVRETAVLILTHLLTNDLIQARDTLSEAARCVIDPTSIVSQLACFLFSELANKGQTLADLMPSILTRLARNNRDVPFAHFQKICDELLPMVKEKRAGVLLEKLSTRIGKSNDLSMCAHNPDASAYFSYAHSILNVRQPAGAADN